MKRKNTKKEQVERYNKEKTTGSYQRLDLFNKVLRILCLNLTDDSRNEKEIKERKYRNYQRIEEQKKYQKEKYRIGNVAGMKSQNSKDRIDNSKGNNNKLINKNQEKERDLKAEIQRMKEEYLGLEIRTKEKKHRSSNPKEINKRMKEEAMESEQRLFVSCRGASMKVSISFLSADHRNYIIHMQYRS